MKTSQPQLIPLRRLRVLPNNPRKITKQSLATLTDSIRTNGFYQHKPLAVEPIEGTDDFYVLDGNQRKKALSVLKRKDAAEVNNELHELNELVNPARHSARIVVKFNVSSIKKY